MGRYDFRPARVRQTAAIVLSAKRSRQVSAPPVPAWFQAIGDVPPSEILTRTLPVQHRNALPTGRRKVRKPSKMFMPQQISYQEDNLRSGFFKDHPWELARPRLVLEDDGKDYQKWDWSKAHQPGRSTGGESVIQRQGYLMQELLGPLTELKLRQLKKSNPHFTRIEVDRARDQACDEARDQAYDQARKEFYAMRHDHEVETRVAREEAMAVGASFGKSQNEIAMELESRTFDRWKTWADGQVTLREQAKSAAYTGGAGGQGGDTTEDDGIAGGLNGEEGRAMVDEVRGSIPATRKGQEALGGVAVHP